MQALGPEDAECTADGASKAPSDEEYVAHMVALIMTRAVAKAEGGGSDSVLTHRVEAHRSKITASGMPRQRLCVACSAMLAHYAVWVQRDRTDLQQGLRLLSSCSRRSC